MGCWRDRFTEEGRKDQQEEERLCYNLSTKSCKKRGGELVES